MVDATQDTAEHNEEVVELARKLLGKWSGEMTVEEVKQKADEAKE